MVKLLLRLQKRAGQASHSPVSQQNIVTFRSHRPQRTDFYYPRVWIDDSGHSLGGDTVIRVGSTKLVMSILGFFWFSCCREAARSLRRVNTELFLPPKKLSLSARLVTRSADHTRKVTTAKADPGQRPLRDKQQETWRYLYVRTAPERLLPKVRLAPPHRYNNNHCCAPHALTTDAVNNAVPARTTRYNAVQGLRTG